MPMFIGLFPYPAAYGVDTLSVPLDLFGMAYDFPPMVLVCNVLMKLQGLDLTLILIALWWPNQSWFLGLLEFSIEYPVELPMM